MSGINGDTLFSMQPIRDMLPYKDSNGDTSYGLTEAGYDIRIKQEVRLRKLFGFIPLHKVDDGRWRFGNFALASAIEEFRMPGNLRGVVHDKSTWARRGLSVFNTVIEPGWKGFLTLELVYHRHKLLVIPAGSGIAQVLFTQLSEYRRYNGKYQNQEDRPVEARSA